MKTEAMVATRVCPSILSADFAHLARDVAAVERAGADMIHVDVMDGQFVPNITIGPVVVKAMRAVTTLPLDVHLMIVDPERYAGDFARAGADLISFHVEAPAATDPARVIRHIRALGKRPALALNPDTPVERVEPFVPLVEMVLVMSVFPGFAAQRFIPAVLEQARRLRSAFPDLEIEIDGGVSERTAAAAREAGANVLVAGSAIFGAPDPAAALRAIRAAALSGAGGGV
ncbi:MAG: ribulose-phosphate 3-epimerase [Planctomycetes bacterium]|nr:ribulose-phosphate 3-epimerase [Planctomycetota bacterium]